jgi:spore coat polysaccharide biosynthesis protein SpsF (cytidylyltransferase family)
MRITGDNPEGKAELDNTVLEKVNNRSQDYSQLRMHATIGHNRTSPVNAA